MATYTDYGWNDVATDAHGYLYPTLYKMIKHHKGKQILDVGCGNGEMACRLIADGFDVYGIDASETGIGVANSRFHGRFFIQDANSELLPEELRKCSFEVVISTEVTEVIEHIYAPRNFMKLISNALPNGGELVISTPYHGYVKNVAMALANKMDAHYTALWDGGHIKFWSKKTITQLLNEFNFTVTQFKGSGRFPFLWKSMFIRAILEK